MVAGCSEIDVSSVMDGSSEFAPRAAAGREGFGEELTRVRRFLLLSDMALLIEAWRRARMASGSAGEEEGNDEGAVVVESRCSRAR